jgi:hypothetical protein
MAGCYTTASGCRSCPTSVMDSKKLSTSNWSDESCPTEVVCLGGMLLSHSRESASKTWYR